MRTSPEPAHDAGHDARPSTSALAGTETLENLAAAFAVGSQANRRYLWFAQQADVEGRPDAAALFRSAAESETAHAHGHLEFLAEVGDPVTGEPIADTDEHLRAAVAGATRASTEMFPGFARTARDEGFDDIADWFETVARAEERNAERFGTGLRAHG